LLTYASLVFEEAESSLSANVSAIIVGAIQLLGVYVSTILVDRVGRKFLLVSSSLCCSLGMALFSAYDYLKHQGMDMTDYKWIPLASFSFIIFVANLGELLIALVIKLFLLSSSMHACRRRCAAIPRADRAGAHQNKQHRLLVHAFI